MKYAINKKTALSFLETFKEGRKSRVHTLTTNGGYMGCNVDLSDIKKRMDGEIFMLTGADETVGHGVMFFDKKYNQLTYLKSLDGVVDEYIKKNNIQPMMGLERYPEFEPLVNDLAKLVVGEINQKAQLIDSKMPYNAQFVLEELIKKLESLV